MEKTLEKEVDELLESVKICLLLFGKKIYICRESTKSWKIFTNPQMQSVQSFYLLKVEIIRGIIRLSVRPSRFCIDVRQAFPNRKWKSDNKNCISNVFVEKLKNAVELEEILTNMMKHLK